MSTSARSSKTATCSLASPPPINRLAKRAFSEALAVRRVAEDELEGLKRAGLAEPRRVAAPDLGDAGEPKRFHIRLIAARAAAFSR
jgi:hypothetical protein